jgi:transglutaminase-like putative cysteine protease
VNTIPFVLSKVYSEDGFITVLIRPADTRRILTPRLRCRRTLTYTSPVTAATPASFDPTADLAPTTFVDFDHPAVAECASALVAGLGADTPLERARAVFYFVRDEIRYDPYAATFEPERYKASRVLEERKGYCVQKAVVLCALGRAVGLPTRMGFADVTNHMASPRLLALMRTDVFAFHGYDAFHLDGRWVKVTAAFDRWVCERFDVEPLEFDGRGDALLQPYNRAGHKVMEYVHDYGSYQDFPLEEMIAAFRRHYPHMFETKASGGGRG